MSSGSPSESTAFRERTELSWQRTGLTVLGSSLVLLRVSGARGGLLTVLLIVAGGLLGLFTTVESRRLSRGPSAVGRGGRVAAILSTAMALLFLAELDAVLSGHH